MRPLIVTCLLLTIPGSSAHAAVLFNEIAWMGTEESYLCNWIELYNSGDQAVDIGDWTLLIDDTERAIGDGEGTSTVLPAGGHWVLERVTNTCPDPVPERDDWYQAFGNLRNSGVTLRLERPDGTAEDQVAAGEDWQDLGGDNDTKDTAQRTDQGWITAAPTPGTANASGATNATTDTTTTTPTTTESDKQTTERATPSVQGSASSRAVPLVERDTELALTIDAPEVGYVHQPVDFSVAASGIGDGARNSLVYHWNFGDTHTSTAREPTHQYTHPGTYVVTVSAAYARYEQVARHEVTVLPITLSLSRASDTDLRLHNDSPYEVDISGYTITGTNTITIPPRTFLLPRSTIVLPHDRLEAAVPGLVVVRDTAGTIVTSTYDDLQAEAPGAERTARTTSAERTDSSPSPSPSPSPARADAQPSDSRASAERDFGFTSRPTVAGVATGTEQSAAPASDAAATTTSPPRASNEVASKTDSQSPNWYPALALLLLIAVAVAVLLWRVPAAERGQQPEE